jgi:hypothetical protein
MKFCDYKPGSIALESELIVGSTVYDASKKDIHTVMAVSCGNNVFERILTIHSVKHGCYQYSIPKGRSKTYPFIFGGVLTGW